MAAMYATPFEGEHGSRVYDAPEDMYEMYDAAAARVSRQKYQQETDGNSEGKMENTKTANDGFTTFKFGTIVFLMLLSLVVSSFSLILVIMQARGSMCTNENNTTTGFSKELRGTTYEKFLDTVKQEVLRHEALQKNAADLLATSIEELTIRTINISAALLEKKMSGVAIPAKCSEVVYNAEQRWVKIVPLRSVGDFTPYFVPCPWDGYIVIQRYLRRSMDFNKDWEKYARGFGDRNGEFWLGLREIHALTASGNYELRINIRSKDGPMEHAKYSTFRISNETDGFRLTVSGYSGSAGNLLSYHNSQRFSTKDRDGGAARYNCATKYPIGFWFNSCYNANLDGSYGAKFPWNPSIILFEMKIRPA